MAAENLLKFRALNPRTVGLGFSVLWVLMIFIILINWRAESQLIKEKVRTDSDAALRSKAMEIEGALKRTYHTVRTISLLPGVRSSPQLNRKSAGQDIVALGLMSSSDYETVQQLYNHIAASVSVSEVYIVHDGFNPEVGQVPFAMFDQVIVDRINRATARNSVLNGSEDTPEQDEQEEYRDYVRQLDFLRTSTPFMPAEGINQILPVNSGILRTCDNSQYTSIRNGDLRNALGFSMSVPIFDPVTRRFKGLVTAVLRSNVFEAILIGRDEVPVPDVSAAKLSDVSGESHMPGQVNYLLEDALSGIRIFDRRNQMLARGTQEGDTVDYPHQVPINFDSASQWMLSSYVSAEAIATALAPGRRTLIVQIGTLSLILVIFWWGLLTLLKRQQQSVQKIRTLADQLEASAQNLARARTDFQATLEAIPDLLFEMGLTGRILDCNSRNADPFIPVGTRFLGRSVSECMPSSLSAVIFTALAESEAFGHSTGHYCELALDQGTRCFELSVSPKTRTEGEEPRFVVLVRDITDRRAAEDQIQSLAFYDALTRLPNRRLMIDRLKHALTSSARSKKLGALLFLDLDNFKAINDTIGQDHGDLMLQQVAKRFAAAIRERDTVAHLGGDEFVVMLEDVGDMTTDAENQAKAIGEKLLATCTNPYRVGGTSRFCSVSVGVTLFGNTLEEFDEPLKRADFAMGQAKASGGNALRFYA